MTCIIGVCGQKFNGKDTIADYVVSKYHFTKISIGDPLKQALQNIFGFTDAQLWGNQKEIIDPFWGMTPRDVMQFVGTDVFRNYFPVKFPCIGDKLWVLALQKKINDLFSRGIHKIIIPDIRFPNEEFIVKKYGGKIIRVNRPSIENIDVHISENSIEDLHPDYIVINDTLVNLYERIDDIFNKII